MPPTAGTRLRFKQAIGKKPSRQHKKVPSLKNRIRALDRFLKRGGEIDDRTRASKKRELEELQQQLDGKKNTEEEKKNAEKYKKPRFFERVKLMRKLKQAKANLDKAEDKSEKRACKAEYETCRQNLMYLYYYPKAEQFLSLFPSKPHTEEALQRQSELRAAAIARFQEEQPLAAFDSFCHAGNQGASGTPSGASAAALLSKKVSKEEEKKRQKKNKQRSKNKGDKSDASKKKEPQVLADREDDDDDAEGKANTTMANGGDDDVEEDDFFL